MAELPKSLFDVLREEYRVIANTWQMPDLSAHVDDPRESAARPALKAAEASEVNPRRELMQVAAREAAARQRIAIIEAGEASKAEYAGITDAEKFVALNHLSDAATVTEAAKRKFEKAEAETQKARAIFDKAVEETRAEASYRKLFERIHAFQTGSGNSPQKLAALCFSGGGIRSATFNLGVIQQLARHGLLDKFHYLSTVSGGGYIGSWLSAWASSETGGVAEVAELLKNDPATDSGGTPIARIPEPPQVTHLRQYSRYLSPRSSALSVDLWTLASAYIRNLALNWVFLIPILLAVLMIPRLFAAIINLNPVMESPNAAGTPLVTASRNLISLTYIAGMLLIGAAFLYALLNEPAGFKTDKGAAYSWWRRFLFVLGAASFAALVIYCVFHSIWIALAWGAALGLLLMSLACLAPLLAYLSRNWRATKRFVLFCLLPFFLGAVCFAAAWSWDERLTKYNYWNFILVLCPMLLALLAAWLLTLTDADNKTICGRLLSVDTISNTIIVGCVREKTFALDATTTFTLHGAVSTLGELPIGSRVQVKLAPNGINAIAVNCQVLFRTVLNCMGRILATLAGAVTAGSLLWVVGLLLHNVHSGISSLHTEPWSTSGYTPETAIYACAAVPLVLAALCFGGMIRIGLLSRIPGNTDAVREWWSRLGGWLLMVNMCWIVVCALVLLGPALLLMGTGNARAAWVATWTGVGGISGLITIFTAKGAKTRGTRDAPQAESGSGTVTRIALSVTMAVFVCLLIASLSLATDGLLTLGAGDSGRDASTHSAMLNLTEDNSTPKPVVQEFLRKNSVVENSDDFSTAHNGLYEFARDPLPSDKWRPSESGKQKEIESAVNKKVEARRVGLGLLGIWFGALALAGIIMSLLINLNRFSLHAIYRNRLVRAYLGAWNKNRKPDNFTGFDEGDNFPMAKLQGVKTPLHVINMALNLTGSKKQRQLALQDRKAESFIVTPYSCGSKELGYRNTSEYATGITIGTALTISGAAVSPNMGYHSSPGLSFLLTLFNVRLGAWLGNPGKAGQHSYKESAPGSGAKYMILEALGLADDTRKFVYLSDGGHFENLGLYEMVRRRCRIIVVCDGGADPDFGFEDLANAIRKIRIDFGIPITFDPRISIVGPGNPDSDVVKGRYCAIGKIEYCRADGEDAEEGRLVYIKPAFYKRNEPVDVRTYATQFKSFPHQTTADQFFTENQFESYRILGSHIVDAVQGRSASTKADTLDEFIRRVEAVVKSPDLPD